MRAIAFLLGLAVILSVGLIAVSNNQQDVTIIYFIGRTWTGKVWVALLASFGAGALLAGLISSFFIIRGMMRFGSLSRRALQLEEEVKSLKQRPMPDESPVFPADPAGAAKALR